MDEEIIEEFNEKFATIEEALKYIADSQAESEFIRKQDNAKSSKEFAEIRELQKQTERYIVQIQRHLDHITKVLRFNIEEYEFQEDKLEKAGEILISKRKNNI
ncbi:MAG: hypothetical protein M3Q33_03650 [Acidobacteriota bacterium]|nr:hypothetical protein [Acidobacteriota bacterium]